MINKIISGGQSGVDLAALDVAMAFNIPVGGFCPLGRVCETGTIPLKYPLIELGTSDYSQRTKKNIIESDGTLICHYDKRLSGGTLLTYQFTKKMNKPLLLLNLKTKIEINLFYKWIEDNKIETLNVAGPRESKNPGVYGCCVKYLSSLFTPMKSG